MCGRLRPRGQGARRRWGLTGSPQEHALAVEAREPFHVLLSLTSLAQHVVAPDAPLPAGAAALLLHKVPVLRPPLEGATAAA